MDSPEWDSSVLFITWDDCGCYVERTFHLPPLGPNDARAYGYKNAFDYTQRPIPPVPMVNRPVPRGAHTDWAQLRQDT